MMISCISYLPKGVWGEIQPYKNTTLKLLSGWVLKIYFSGVKSQGKINAAPNSKKIAHPRLRCYECFYMSFRLIHTDIKFLALLAGVTCLLVIIGLPNRWIQMCVLIPLSLCFSLLPHSLFFTPVEKEMAQNVTWTNFTIVFLLNCVSKAKAKY